MFPLLSWTYQWSVYSRYTRTGCCCLTDIISSGLCCRSVACKSCVVRSGEVICSRVFVAVLRYVLNGGANALQQRGDEIDWSESSPSMDPTVISKRGPSSPLMRGHSRQLRMTIDGLQKFLLSTFRVPMNPFQKPPRHSVGLEPTAQLARSLKPANGDKMVSYAQNG
jgi:hypothetical protein